MNIPLPRRNPLYQLVQMYGFWRTCARLTVVLGSASQTEIPSPLVQKWQKPLCSSAFCMFIHVHPDRYIYIHPHLSIPWVSQALLGYGEVGGTTVGSEAPIYQT